MEQKQTPDMEFPDRTLLGKIEQDDELVTLKVHSEGEIDPADAPEGIEVEEIPSPDRIERDGRTISLDGMRTYLLMWSF